MHKITASDPESHSADLLAANIAKLKELFPEVVAEGKVDFKALQEILGNEVESGEEFYRFTWAGKAQARREAHKPSTGTLRPAPEESVDWANTKNLYIEGDNLEVLKLLQKSYGGKVKMIYIDPPYNTGKDFVYKDNYRDNLRNYKELTGQVDSEGNTLSTNSDTDGRYHSNWLNMMYPRLRLARNLLRDDGVMFVSIDDHEANNLKKLLDDIFGEENFIADLTVVNNLKGRNDKKYIATANERLMLYMKTDNFQENGLSLPESKLSTYTHADEAGAYRLIELRKRGGSDTRLERPNMFYPLFVDQDSGRVSLEDESGKRAKALPIKSDGTEGRWRWGIDTAKNRLGVLIGKKVQGSDKYNIYEKDYLSEDGLERRIKPKSVMGGAGYSSDVATKEYRSIMGAIDFTNPKPVLLLSDLIDYSASPTSAPLILDFFSGSGTTAHAVMQLNAEDGGQRQHIQVQLPEPTDASNEAHKAGYSTIAEIGKERIRRAGKKIVGELEAAIKALEARAVRTEEEEQELEEKQERLAKLDIGFRVFKLDSSNIAAWDGDPERMQENLLSAAENIKPDRTEADVLYEVLLKYGLDLTLPIEERAIAKCTVYNVGMGALFLCLAERITNAVAEGIGQWKDELKPETCRVIFRDNGFTDVEKTNAMQTLKRYGVTEVRSV